jgi:hypothetical protein
MAGTIPAGIRVTTDGRGGQISHTITVLHVTGCAGGAAALTVASGIARARADVSVKEVVIEDEATAITRGFRGSPTVQIDGHDLEPETEIPIGSMG